MPILLAALLSLAIVTPEEAAPFAGLWGRSDPPAPAILVRDNGLATLHWRTGAEQSGAAPAGHAFAVFDRREGSALSGRITSSNDQAVVGTDAAVTLTLLGPGMAELRIGEQAWVVCHYAFRQRAAPATIAAEPCGPGA